MTASEGVLLNDHDRGKLERLLRSGTTEQRLFRRIGIVLAFADDLSVKAVAARCECNRETARLWRDRWVKGGLEGLSDAPGRGRKPVYVGEEEAKIIAATLEAPEDETHWSARRLAKKVKAGKSTVQRIWNRNGLQPHRQKTFKYSNDPHLVEKVVDVVGLYLDPPERALVLSIDEKSQIQALDRTQPGLPMKKGRCGTMTHDYKRNGTTALFAALNVLDGRVIGECHPRHRHQEFLGFLRRLNQEFLKKLDLHLILDNYGTHNHPKVKKWLEKHPRFKLHFTPTSGSWLNLVERWFRDLTDNRIRRGVFRSVPELIKAIDEYIAANNDQPKPFVWTAAAHAILEKVSKCRVILGTVH